MDTEKVNKINNLSQEVNCVYVYQRGFPRDLNLSTESVWSKLNPQAQYIGFNEDNHVNKPI